MTHISHRIKAERVFRLFGICCGAECLGIAFDNKTFVTNGIANLDIIPIIVTIWTISIFVMVVIKAIIDKKAAEE